MLETLDPWRRPHRPQAGGATGGVGITTVYRPGVHVPLPPAPAAAGWARRRGVEALRDRGLGQDTLDVISLLITELVTNALLHGLRATAAMDSAARCPRCGSQICLNLREEPGGVLVEVFDAAPIPPRRAQAKAVPGFAEAPMWDAERGRGLVLVSNLSEEQGYHLPPAGGKVVWCVVKAGV